MEWNRDRDLAYCVGLLTVLDIRLDEFCCCHKTHSPLSAAKAIPEDFSCQLISLMYFFRTDSAQLPQVPRRRRRPAMLECIDGRLDVHADLPGCRCSCEKAHETCSFATPVRKPMRMSRYRERHAKRASRMPAMRPRQMNGTRLKDFLATLAFGHQRPGFFTAEGGSRSVDAHDRGQQHDDDVRLFHRHAALHDVTARANFTGSRRAAGPSRSGIYIRQGGCPVERRDRPDTGVPACRYRRPRTPARRRRCWSGVATDTTTRWHADHCSSFSTSSS